MLEKRSGPDFRDLRSYCGSTCRNFYHEASQHLLTRRRFSVEIVLKIVNPVFFNVVAVGKRPLESDLILASRLPELACRGTGRGTSRM
jgi:hypothetical protein